MTLVKNSKRRKIEEEIWKLGDSWVKIGYNPALRNNGEGNLIPRVEHRVNVSVGF